MRSEVRQARRRHLRHGLLQLALLLAVAGILLRAFQLQVVQHDHWEQLSLSQNQQRIPVAAPRGTIYDREGRVLAVGRTTYEIAVATNELTNREAAARAVREVLGVRAEVAREIVKGERRWIPLPGRHSAVKKETLEARIEGGIHFTRVVDRFYPRGRLAAEIIGRVDAEGRGQSGLELGFDSLLAGQPGVALRRRIAGGASTVWVTEDLTPPSPGGDLYLTIDAEMQSIAESVLEDAVRNSGAEGGDLLVVDPNTGELLAAASLRVGQPPHLAHLAAATEPFEAGSTLKPFTAAALLEEELAGLSDIVDTGAGLYRTAGRTIHDEHPHGRLNLAQTLTVSSNVGMAMFAERLPTGVQFSYLRDFGFGTPTGLTYPSESSGTLRRPAEWSAQSRASLAIGYEVAVTPLQLAMAYATIANGGLLMRPQLVREARGPDGATRWATRPELIRRVISGAVASEIRGVLAHAVTEGTGQGAGVRGLSVAGKTGTAWRFDREQGYAGGAYTASFVGLIPSDDPQLVILVKLDKPSGAYYGGATAAPVMRSALRAALAGSYWSVPPLMGEPEIPDKQAGVTAGQAPASGPYVFALDAPLMRAQGENDRRQLDDGATVPNVTGLSFRAAAHRLHRSGWRVIVQGGGRVESTRPPVGTRLRRGEAVVLLGSGRSPPDRPTNGSRRR
ncbi:MAG: PASTA domain-containing protein [Gemmatimonadetes bacterium]|uniref:PASTA domain-containing protein n=1 Tax=Candidatus Kutchimonas denitrificans TaxID=3056748 RepID=A0AAE4Z6L2_9BACT|nr:PASTA domain-containing protein [Gemmatimonadota bacterium]NIR74543.1 PASTA domain-containing protein [Candidatus Kutchimonas denitrificans]NIS02733.1 PASTA domain-containing protein [Gemmatimonadota bacterium]NIT68894.1 PASTA domain-containing protein [Gemmatimonadota bacterium]NIU52199.1 PASTA domain-containing protein [Gemmatimonadota bacterium]